MRDGIESSLIALRSLREEFFYAYAQMFSETIRAILHVPSVENELAYLHDRVQALQQRRTLFYCIFIQQSDQLIGAIEIRNQQEHPGQLYSWIHEDYWGKGYYQQALCVAAQEYFNITQQRFFTAHVDIANARSYYALKKCGFAQAGFFNGPYSKQYALLLRNKIKE